MKKNVFVGKGIDWCALLGKQPISYLEYVSFITQSENKRHSEFTDVLSHTHLSTSTHLVRVELIQMMSRAFTLTYWWRCQESPHHELRGRRRAGAALDPVQQRQALPGGQA